MQLLLSKTVFPYPCLRVDSQKSKIVTIKGEYFVFRKANGAGETAGFESRGALQPCGNAGTRWCQSARVVWRLAACDGFTQSSPAYIRQPDLSFPVTKLVGNELNWGRISHSPSEGRCAFKHTELKRFWNVSARRLWLKIGAFVSVTLRDGAALRFWRNDSEILLRVSIVPPFPLLWIWT